jgi:hypothetical protein
MTRPFAITATTPDGYVADTVGGYPYCIAVPGLCSVRRNHGVEEEHA